MDDDTAVNSPSWQDFVFGKTSDVLSGWIDYTKAKNDASLQERISWSQVEQERQLRSTELQYQNRGQPLQVISSGTTTGVPSWVMGAGLAVGVTLLAVALWPRSARG